MSKRIALWMTVLSCLAAWTVWAADASPAALNALHDLTTTARNGTVVVQVTGNYPIMDYTYYDYDPETFVVDMADVDVSALPKTLAVNKDGVQTVKVESISQARGRALAKLEIHKAYLAKCIVSTEGNKLLVRVVGAGSPPPAQAASAASPADKAGPAASAAKAEPASQAPAEPAAANAASLPEADRLVSVDVAQDGSAVDIKADGTPRYKYFTMKNPDRIVVDLLGVRRGRVPSHVEGAGAIQRVRIGIHKNDPPVTRVVLDMKKAVSPVSVDSSGASVVVRLNADTRRASADQAPKGESADSKRVPTPDMAQAKAAPAPAPVPAAAQSKPAIQPVAKSETPAPAKSSGLDKVKVDLSPIKPGASKEFKGYQDLFVAQNSESKSAEGKTVSGGAVPLSFKEKTISGEAVKYTGEPISLSLKDADIKDVLRMFHDISGMNIVVHPGVQGKVTVDLTNVPWDQAMDIILKNNGLDYIYENNVIWVAPAAEIARKFAEQQRLQKEKLLAEQPVTFIKRLSYAKAASMAAIAGKFLSERGHIIVDPRTNSLIIQEVPSKKASLLKLIDSLDTATPQVLIEARIVETNITWSQSFGITWSGNWYSGLDSSGNLNTTHGGSTGSGPAGTYTLHNFGNTAGWPNVGQGDFAVTLPPSASNGFIDLVLGNTTGSFFLDVKLAALENTGRGRVLSAPRIVTQDNQKATIESGRQIPIRVATTDKISVIFVNATLKLDVTPQISADGNVNMTVDITNDSVDFANQEPGNPPPIIKKEAKTVLKVHDGQTAVIGGVFVTNEGVSQNGLPFLSKIPVLGWLFKNRTKSRTNDELLIFLTPKIIR